MGLRQNQIAFFVSVKVHVISKEVWVRCLLTLSSFGMTMTQAFRDLLALHGPFVFAGCIVWYSSGWFQAGGPASGNIPVYGGFCQSTTQC